MKTFEEKALATASEQPRVWKQYVDDIFTIMKQNSINNFVNHLNQQHPSIHFTMET